MISYGYNEVMPVTGGEIIYDFSMILVYFIFNLYTTLGGKISVCDKLKR